MLKRSIYRGLLVALAAVTAGGCSVVGEPAAQRVAPVVAEYCERESFQSRQLYRQTINAELAADGHSLQVNCAGDPEE